MFDLAVALHIVAAVLFLGPVTVALSMFPRKALAAREDPQALGSAKTLNRISRVYGGLSALVPLLGVLVMFTMPDVFFRDVRFHVSIVIAVIAWGLILFYVVPRQGKLLDALAEIHGEPVDNPASAPQGVDWESSAKKLSAASGIFALLWVILAVIMFLPFSFGLA